MEQKYIYTNNKDKLEIIQPFKFLRGIDSMEEKMGQAKDENGKIYDIYTAPCNLPTCYCWATAKEIINKE